MDIKIIDSWLREFVKTPAKPEEIARNLSLTSQSVERINKVEKDFVYDIEVTSNRPDVFSTYGIARELSAVLPRFGIEAELLPIPEVDQKIPEIKDGLPLEVKIAQSSLVPRFTALIFDNVTIKPSPEFVQKRLEISGIRALNNVIDISNYLMLELGQPMHTFDYDKILGAKMIVRQSKEGEEIVTLDGQLRKLPPGTIIIEDGEQRIIDLCGIMGGKISEVDENTKRVLLFVQTYDPISIRRSCQGLSFRTEAASRFEKGIDPEGVLIAMKRAIGLFRDWTEGQVASQLFDIYPNPPEKREITLEKKRLDRLMGIEIEFTKAKEILENLGFKTRLNQQAENLVAEVPHWRLGDVEIPEDLIEEIARLYGYFNLPNNLPPISFPQTSDPILQLENEIKTALKFWGYTETPTYSMTSAQTLTKAAIDSKNLLKLANPLSEDLLYLRTTLLPSLLEVVLKNINFSEIKIFEISNVYPPQGVNNLPAEKSKLAGLISPGDFRDSKGVIEAIFEELGIENVRYEMIEDQSEVFSQASTAIFVGQKKVGQAGEVSEELLVRFGINRKVAFFDLDLSELLPFTNKLKKYIPISKYPAIIEDLAFVVPEKITVAEVIKTIETQSPLIKKVELVDMYQTTRTFRITYQSYEGNLTDKDIEPIREKIIKDLKQKEVAIKKKAE
ncbi:MAG: phenylalanine--tRNA ligase subunit beta [Patescibacteria group bacterium]|jgi:phenylalanyl-tRNA synthetase beta chain